MQSPIVIRRGFEARRRLSGVGVGALGSAEEQDVGFGLVDFVVLPPPGLLDAQEPPLVFGEELALLGDFLHDLLGQDHVPVLVVVVVVFFRVFDLARVMRHLNIIIQSPILSMPQPLSHTDTYSISVASVVRFFQCLFYSPSSHINIGKPEREQWNQWKHLDHSRCCDE